MSQEKTNNKPEPVSIFIAYSRKDISYLEKLRTYLKPLARRKDVKIWYDGDIEIGSNWDAVIDEHLHSADIILPLISADALDSDYFYDVEMKIALERHEKEEVLIIPIILKTCMWEDEIFGQLQALPKDGKPIENWQREAEAYTNVVRALKEQISKLRKKKKIIKQIEKFERELGERNELIRKTNRELFILEEKSNQIRNELDKCKKLIKSIEQEIRCELSEINEYLHFANTYLKEMSKNLADYSYLFNIDMELQEHQLTFNKIMALRLDIFKVDKILKEKRDFIQKIEKERDNLIQKIQVQNKLLEELN